MLTVSVIQPNAEVYEGYILKEGDVITPDTTSVFIQDSSAQQRYEQALAINELDLNDFDHRPIKRTLIDRPATMTNGRVLIAPVVSAAVTDPRAQNKRPVGARVNRVQSDTRLIFIGGKYGSGKDTLAQALAFKHKNRGFEVLRNKDFYRDASGRFQHADYSKEEGDNKVCELAAKLLSDGKHVIVVDYFVIPRDDIASYKDMIYSYGQFSEEEIGDIEKNTLVFMARGEFEAKDGLPTKVKDAMSARRAEAYRNK